MRALTKNMDLFCLIQNILISQSESEFYEDELIYHTHTYICKICLYLIYLNTLTTSHLTVGVYSRPAPSNMNLFCLLCLRFERHNE